LPSPSMIYRAYRDALAERIPYQLLQFSDGTTMTYPRFFIKIMQEKGYIISQRFTGVASGSSVQLYMENPSGSGRNIYIIEIEAGSLAQAHLDIYRENTVTSNGTSLEPLPLYLGSNKKSVVYAEHSGTHGLGKLALNTVVPGGSRTRAIGSIAEVGETLVIPPGQNMVVQLTNASASATDMSIKIVWWEE